MSLRTVSESALDLPEFSIQSVPNKVPLHGYVERLKLLAAERRVIEVPFTKINACDLEWNVYLANDKKLISGNYGVLLYYRGMLINRYVTYFGDLFKCEFFKSKYRQATTVFSFLGLINIKEGVNLNFFHSDFKKTINYYNINEAIYDSLTKAKHALTHEIPFDEHQGKATKKVKV